MTEDGRSRPTDGGTEHRGPERTGGEGEGFVGDGRTKHVTVLTGDGELREHGDVYVKHSADAYLVSPTFQFPESETIRYEKADCERVTITQHHSSCFITTAAAGEGETLDSLRSFRDEALAATPAGRALVAVYERISPPVAATLAAHPGGRTAGAVRLLVERCGALADRRRRAGPVGRIGFTWLLTALYVVGVCIALAGHVAVTARARLRSERRTVRGSRGD